MSRSELASSEVLDTFGTWFHDLRVRLRGQRLRGHSNPCLVLHDGVSVEPSPSLAVRSPSLAMAPAVTPDAMIQQPAVAASPVVEVIDSFAHVFLLEESHRAALNESERQWRTFLSRHQLVPRTVASTAMRLHQRLVVDRERLLRLGREESVERAAIEVSRERWLRDLCDRARFELEALAYFVMRSFQERRQKPLCETLTCEETQQRKLLAESAQSWLQQLQMEAEARLVDLQEQCILLYERQQQQGEAVACTITAETVSRGHINEAERSQRKIIADACSQRLAALQVYVAAAIVSGLDSEKCMQAKRRTHALDEVQNRDHVVRSEMAFFEEIVAAFHRSMAAIQAAASDRLALMQQAAQHAQSSARSLIVDEASGRNGIADAWQRWFSETLVLQFGKDIQELQLAAETRAVQIRADARLVALLVAEEKTVRQSIENSRWDWLRFHFVPMEALQRTDLPRLIEERRCQCEAVRNREMRRWMGSAEYRLIQDETKLRSNIIYGECKWRAELGLRLERIVDLWRQGEGAWITAQWTLSTHETALRSAIVDSEKRWREQLASMVSMQVARVAAAAKARGNGSSVRFGKKPVGSLSKSTIFPVVGKQATA